jgi:hypothetical protein
LAHWLTDPQEQKQALAAALTTLADACGRDRTRAALVSRSAGREQGEGYRAQQNQLNSAKVKPKHQRQALGTYVLMLCVRGFELIDPGKRWEQGGVSRWIGFPLSVVLYFLWLIYAVAPLFVLALALFYVESAFFAPRAWLVFNLVAGFVVLGISSLLYFTNVSGLIAAAFCFWVAYRIAKIAAP